MCTVSFQKKEKSLLKHQEHTMPPDLPAPETLPTRQQRIELIK